MDWGGNFVISYSDFEAMLMSRKMYDETLKPKLIDTTSGVRFVEINRKQLTASGKQVSTYRAKMKKGKKQHQIPLSQTFAIDSLRDMSQTMHSSLI